MICRTRHELLEETADSAKESIFQERESDDMLMSKQEARSITNRHEGLGESFF